MPVSVGPHSFEPLGVLDRLRCALGSGILARCRRCYLPHASHPAGWTEARFLGDRSRQGPEAAPLPPRPRA